MTAGTMTYNPAVLRSTARTAPMAVRSASLRSIAVATAALLLAPLAPTLVALAIDGRTFNGAPLWIKPLHFDLSFGIQFVTLALLSPLLSASWRASRALRWSMLAAAFAGLMEIAWVTTEAALGRASHFSVATPLEQALYALMGVFSLFIVFGSGLFGFALGARPPPQALCSSIAARRSGSCSALWPLCLGPASWPRGTATSSAVRGPTPSACRFSAGQRAAAICACRISLPPMPCRRCR